MPDILTAVEELEALRKSNAELLKKSRERKTKVTEHETTIADLTARLTIAETALHNATVGTPLRAMAAMLSPVPELWMTEFAKHYKAEMKDGKIVLLDADGKPVMDGDCEVGFDAQALNKLLISSDNEELASFPHIMYGSRASGGGANPSPTSSFSYPEKQDGKQSDKPQFGLR